jgi:hypothetical protein
MELEGSLQCSQEPATGPCPEPDRPVPRLFITFRNRLIFYGEELLAPRITPSLEDHPCRLSATAYSVYSQLPSISVGRVLHPQPEDAPCRGDKWPTLRGASYNEQSKYAVSLAVFRNEHSLVNITSRDSPHFMESEDRTQASKEPAPWSEPDVCSPYRYILFC